MAKKILILLVVMVVCLASFNVLALNLNDDSEFEEATTDTSIMLDSPLFTQKEDYEENTLKLSTKGYEHVLTYKDFEVYVLDYDYSEFEGYEEDEELKNEFKTNLERTRAFNVRIKNTKTGYVWSTDGQGNKSQTQAFFLGVSSKEFSGEIASNNIDVRISYTTNEKDTLTFHVDLINDDIEFDYSLKFNDEGFNLLVDQNSIKEEGQTQLTSITLFPWFGSVRVNQIKETDEEGNEIAGGKVERTVSIPGYIVIPSGNGGLIRYEANPTINSIYTTEFYGNDLNFHNSNTRLDETLSMPVYGMVHGVNQQACLVEINEGSSIARFNYEAAWYNGASEYHKSYLTFNFRRNYNIQASKVITMVSDMSNCNVDVDYTFLTGEEANYVGMAKRYQASLVKKGVLGNADLADSTQAHIEAFGREYEDGLFGKKYVNMTTINDLVNINQELAQAGVDNTFYTLKGYYKGGYSGATPTNVNFEGKLGNLNKLNDENMDYYLYYNPVETRGSRLSLPGYNLVGMSRKEYYLIEEENAKYTFFTDVKTISSGVEKAIEKYGSNVAVDGITQYLYGDYNHNYQRLDTYNLYSTMLGNDMYPMYAPNAYLLGNASKYLNMNLYHEQMKFITDSVPFTQIVLRGYVDLFSTYLNFSSNQDIDVLKCIEYGVYPAYLITQEASHNLSKTLSNNLYATEYNRVKDRMFADYAKVKGALDNVVGAKIVEREVLELGVIEVTYSNGVKIVVDYNEMGFEVIK